MHRILLRKLPGVIATAAVVAVITFLLIHLAPGDPLDAYLGQEGASQAEKAVIREKLGLDKPLNVRFVKYVKRLCAGDLGSIPGKGPVRDIMAHRFAATARLAVAAILLAVVLGVSTGLAGGWHANSLFDKALQCFLLLFVSAPIFWSGLLALLLFSWALNLLPAAGSQTPAHLVLPALVLASRPAALVSRVARANTIEARSQPFVLAAMARGLPNYLIVMKHVLKVVSIPVVTIVGMDFAGLLSGAVITETVFSYQGLGQFAVEAITNRWYDAVMAVAMLWAVIFVCANFLVDVSYSFLDPRVRAVD